ncbi:MAG: 4Fe-4S binding protein [Sedimentisphaerales bacterium]|nr:4Fe-4S binding protein [Sedimentisphaerales bacterium]
MLNKSSFFKTIILFVLLIVFVIGTSLVSNRIWSGKPKEIQEPNELIIEDGMTIGRFGEVNKLPNPVLKEIFQLQSPADRQKNLSQYGSPDQIRFMVTGEKANASEYEIKNWKKIAVKFILWLSFLIAVFFSFIKRKVTRKKRLWVLFASVVIFGVIMGSDPGPMGTVKDAITLYGKSREIFPPRLVAMTVFLLIVFIANKYICAWGCQAGTLQDLIFRLNQNDKGNSIIGRQIKIPFVVTNTIRIIFLSVFTLTAFLWSYDIVEPIDPFKIFKPSHLGIIGAVFVGVLLLGSLFIYRPWCHLFCPFGLAGWIVEKFSRVKISVNYDTCIACNKCAKACPSTVMSAILKQDKKTIPDCFACYTCRDVCPTNSISFSSRKRTTPPPGHFDKAGKV